MLMSPSSSHSASANASADSSSSLKAPASTSETAGPSHILDSDKEITALQDSPSTSLKASVISTGQLTPTSKLTSVDLAKKKGLVSICPKPSPLPQPSNDPKKSATSKTYAQKETYHASPATTHISAPQKKDSISQDDDQPAQSSATGKPSTKKRARSLSPSAPVKKLFKQSGTEPSN
ncbi:uncharacterized protein LOC107303399 [Oryza brachyantha]|uniref:uncharacterized protein LOC107303399 n=1 Tax=Oryza brachyantha TaxID=4533 RepID=UPI0007768535|nr:uncharacterized protein LOC107303399 [Oryza brachyantha]